jgi:hypothetical protein
MIFASPWVLFGLAALPVLWWLLRVTPPAPRVERFPAVRLLLGLVAEAETPARTPIWLLVLRCLAAALVILGLARPVLDAAARLPGSGPVLLVIDNGWASARDWGQRQIAAASVLDRAERAGRPVVVLATAPAETGQAPQASAAMSAADARPLVAALRPQPWPVDRAAAAGAVAAAKAGAAVVLSDGTTGGSGWDAYARALAAIGPVVEMGDPAVPVRLLLPPRPLSDGFGVRLAQTPQALAGEAAVRAVSGDGRTLARLTLPVAANAAGAEGEMRLPPELRNRLARLVLDGPASAGSVVLLDERWRRRPVGLLAGDAATAQTPLIGELFYLKRALEPSTELRYGDLPALLSREISVIILADRTLADGPEREMLADWVSKGGLLIRFAGPQLAEHPDTLLPVKLIEGDRQLGGAMSWSKPAALAPFPPGSPFAGLRVPAEVRVTRQVLAAPRVHLAEATWAQLEDGTPLVTQAVRGAGRVVLFHVTANADWSDLPLSGLFVDMLRRLIELANGVRGAEDGSTRLAPVETLDGFGQPGAPPVAAAAMTAAELRDAVAGPRSPPGLYGPESNRRALNLANRLPPPEVAPAIPGASEEAIGGIAPERALAPWLLAAALALLIADLLVSLPMRGLVRLGRTAAVLALLAAGAAHAQQPPELSAERNPALATRLAYVVTGDAVVDGISRAGLIGLSDYVNRRTAAVLAEPAAVEPGRDDLSFYPLLYWPLTPDAQPPGGAAIEALNTFMANGGIILIDTRDGGSGEGFAAGTEAALRRAARGLAIPALTPLTQGHVLAKSFYLLSDFPGRFDGAPVWVQRDQDRSNDSVSPVIIGGHDWAAAWAVDAQGRNPYATIPGGARQRVLAYRFGVNLVMYALTGNYKGDQVHVPALLQRLGQ